MPGTRHSSAGWIRAMLGFTVGLLAFLTFDATLEAFELVTGNSSFGGPLVVILGALISYLVLEASPSTTPPKAWPSSRPWPANGPAWAVWQSWASSPGCRLCSEP